MTMLIIQTLLLMAIAYILGCILGCLFRYLFGQAEVPAAAIATGAAATGVAAATLRTPEPAPKPVTPVPPKPRVVTPPPPAPKPAPAPVTLKAAEPKPAPAKVSKPRPKPKPKAKPKAKARRGKPDDLKLIKGIGKQNEARLNALGIKYFDQIADWKKKDQEEWGDRLAFPGRIEREDWVKQAKRLAKGQATEFSKRVSRGEVQTSVGKGAVGSMGKKPKGLRKAARGGKSDNLTLIDGVGNAIEQKLFKLGIYHFSQIASMSKDEATWLGNEIGFPGRVERENWIGESKILAAGGTTEHARRVERGQITTSRKSRDDEK